MTRSAGDATVGGNGTAGASLRSCARMPGLLGLLVYLSVGSGCTEPVSVSRQRAGEKWRVLRSDVGYQVAEQAFESGSFDTARRKLAELLHENPDHDAARLLLARVLIESRAIDEADAVLGAFLGRDPAVPEAAFLLGVTAEMRQRYQAAARFYAMAARGRKAYEPYVAAAVEAKLSAWDAEGARAFLLSVDRPGAVTPRWLCMLAEIARAEGDDARAAELYERALGLDESGDSGGAAWMSRELAGAYLRSGRTADAAVVYERLLANPEAEDRGRLMAALARCRVAMGDAAGAERLVGGSTFDEEVDATPILLDAARVYVEQSRWADAGRVIDLVLTREPSNADGLMLQALWSAEVGDVPGAFVALARWRRVDPTDPMIESMRSYLAGLDRASVPRR